jgi:hypothetical protein
MVASRITGRAVRLPDLHATVQLGKFGVRIECRDFVVQASNNITIKGSGQGRLESSSTMTIRGSAVNVN